VTPSDDATRAQIAAADPACSTWLSANAGSGKTRVLTDRVARLLLAGTDPRRILCLTYTKAAAGEMQNRLFARLGAWAMLPDDRLEGELRGLGVESPVELPKARTLFAAAIETPGGLKIQTIHSFCAALLRHYPLEAGVSPRFTELDETTDRLLMAEVAEALAEGPDAEVVDGIARFHGGQDFDRLTASIVQAAEAFAGEPDADEIWRACGLPPGLGEYEIAAQVFTGGERALLDAILPALRTGSTNDVKAAEKLASLAAGPLGFAALEPLEGCFLTGEKADPPFASRRGKFPTKATRDRLGPLADDLDALMDRVEGARRTRLSLEAARKTLALRRFAARFLPLYEARKRDRGWLSFDDLIRKARDLLSHRPVASWVLFNLDGGIDHILVDEAQDTSPGQWAVIEHLAEEFAAGDGARSGRERTLFVVGDKKQSIYSFQGADAEGFDRMRHHFEERLRPVNPLVRRELLYSFRSSTAVLATVDRTFSLSAAGGVAPDLRHHAYHGTLAGRVDVWPLLEPGPKEEEDDDWEKPVDRASAHHHTLRLAQGIAAEIATMLARGETIPDRDGRFRRLSPGDILILVQRRQGKPSLFAEIIAALKAERLPVAGADRLRLKDSLAVRDLLALLAFLALPEDDLSLAAALRSPLFGWTESQLYTLAQGRAGFLWETLRRGAAAQAWTLTMLDDLRKEADFLRPYDLLERILVRHDGRARLLARLGPEAEDGIDALQNLALAYERTEAPSLTGFLSWLEAEDTEIRRQLESAGGRIRVMTVHGSKGLEAPMVILPDTVRRKEQRLRSEIVVGEDGKGWWVTPKNASPAIVDRARDAALAAEDRERERLLYVAMTRAQTWLVICGAGDPAHAQWHSRIAAGVAALVTLPIATPTGEGQRYQHGDWSAQAPSGAAPPEPAPALPGWLAARAPVPPEAPRPLSPSDLGGAKALPGEAAVDEEASLRHGRQVHRLLEHLPAYPQPDWPRLAPALLSHGEDAAPPAEAARLLAEVAGILTNPDLGFLFGPDTLAEIPLTAELPAFPGRPLVGTVDRLIVSPDRVLVVDFKTNAVVPATAGEVPAGILRQMGAYAAAMALIYPGRRIETAILWTRTATLMPLPHEMVMAALAEPATS
jgi:ATP-dependent helicase/nuclease subunit A